MSERCERTDEQVAQHHVRRSHPLNHVLLGDLLPPVDPVEEVRGFQSLPICSL